MWTGFEVEKLPCGIRQKSTSYRAKAIAFSPDGKLFATADRDHTLSLFSAEGNQLAQLKGHSDCVRSVAFSPDGKLLASGSWDRTVKIWVVATRNVVRTLASQPEPVDAVAFSPDGKLLAIGTGDWRTDKPGEVELWDPGTGKHIRNAWHSPRDVKALAFSPDGKRLAVAHAAGAVAIVSVDLPTPQMSGADMHLARGNDGAVFAVVGPPVPIASLSCPTGATAVAFSPDGKILAAGQWNGKLRLWDAATLAPLVSRPIPAHGEMIFDLAFAPGGKNIATASKDGTVRVWKVAALTTDRSESDDRIGP